VELRGSIVDHAYSLLRVVAATGGGTTGDTTGGTTGSTSGGSSGGGGCSIGAGDNRSLAFLLLAAMIMLVYRRRRD